MLTPSQIAAAQGDDLIRLQLRVLDQYGAPPQQVVDAIDAISATIDGLEQRLQTDIVGTPAVPAT